MAWVPPGKVFQSTHPRGVRLGQHGGAAHGLDVSIHAPAWGATRLRYRACRLRSEFQSTHPRGVRRRRDRETIRHAHVSIHAPAWGATRQERRRRMPRPVSIHAPAWGATQGSASIRSCRNWFQSTHPRGVRRRNQKGKAPSCRVSIHAPAWGATCPREVRRLAKSLFQSTHPRGVRLLAALDAQVRQLFQSTHPRGVRLRDREGRQAVGFVSIHAPAWGAT